MKPQNKSRIDPTKPSDIITDVPQTPSSDMQPEDAGTPESGNTGRGTASDEPLKRSGGTVNGSAPKR